MVSNQVIYYLNSSHILILPSSRACVVSEDGDYGWRAPATAGDVFQSHTVQSRSLKKNQEEPVAGMRYEALGEGGLGSGLDGSVPVVLGKPALVDQLTGLLKILWLGGCASF